MKKELLFFIVLTPVQVVSLHYAGFAGRNITVDTLESGDETEVFLKRIEELKKRHQLNKTEYLNGEYTAKRRNRDAEDDCLLSAATFLENGDFNAARDCMESGLRDEKINSNAIRDCLAELYLLHYRDIDRAQSYFQQTNSAYGQFLLYCFEKDAYRKEKYRQALTLAANTDDIAFYFCEGLQAYSQSDKLFSLLHYLNETLKVLEKERSFSARDWIMCEVHLLLAEWFLFHNNEKLFAPELYPVGMYGEAIPALIGRNIVATHELRLRTWYYKREWKERCFSFIIHNILDCLIARVNCYLALLYYNEKKFQESFSCIQRCRLLHEKLIFPLLLFAELKKVISVEIPQLIPIGKKNAWDLLKDFDVITTQKLMPALRIHSLIRLAEYHQMGTVVPKDLKKARSFFLKATLIKGDSKYDKEWKRYILISLIESGIFKTREINQHLIEFRNVVGRYKECASLQHYAQELYARDRKKSSAYFNLLAMTTPLRTINIAAIAQVHGIKRYKNVV